jgi:hypothetical protein
MRFIASFFIMLLSSLAFCYSQDVSVSHTIDWQGRFITFTVIAPVDQRGLPVSKQRAEALVASQKEQILANDLATILLDTYGAFSLPNDLVRLHLSYNLYDMTNFAVKQYEVFSDDLKFLHVIYRLTFADITRYIQRLDQTDIQPYLAGAQIDFPYTGIVIYVAEPLPNKHIPNTKKAFVPSFLPSLYSNDGRVLISSSTVDLKYFQQWGTVGFSTNTQGKWDKQRVGDYPLVVSAQQLYGELSTDVMINNADANKILASAIGRKLLAQGKVIFIVPPTDTPPLSR